MSKANEAHLRHSTTPPFDVIVVGARCAGSPTAMLLALKGYRVLLVDRATFPSDTVSTHLVHPVGVEALSRWGLLERLIATGCPPIHTYDFDFGPFTISMDNFARMNAGTISPAEFFAPENVDAILTGRLPSVHGTGD
jgi:2-polyprenyl-6-methoxyphenol hydroxylase-like FAD-dependent oxidoreductase